jgi:hypothetical protein
MSIRPQTKIILKGMKSQSINKIIIIQRLSPPWWKMEIVANVTKTEIIINTKKE